MTKIYIIVIAIILHSYIAFSQSRDSLALQSLEYLNQQFNLNLNKTNDIILIRIENSEEFICYKYLNKTDLPDISIITWRYEIRSLSNNKYEITLNNSSRFEGTFECIKSNEGYKFVNLKYNKRID